MAWPKRQVKKSHIESQEISQAAGKPDSQSTPEPSQTTSELDSQRTPESSQTSTPDSQSTPEPSQASKLDSQRTPESPIPLSQDTGSGTAESPLEIEVQTPHSVTNG